MTAVITTEKSPCLSCDRKDLDKRECSLSCEALREYNKGHTNEEPECSTDGCIRKAHIQGLCADCWGKKQKRDKKKKTLAVVKPRPKAKPRPEKEKQMPTKDEQQETIEQQARELEEAMNKIALLEEEIALGQSATTGPVIGEGSLAVCYERIKIGLKMLGDGQRLVEDGLLSLAQVAQEIDKE